jgi:hypothetical protein
MMYVPAIVVDFRVGWVTLVSDVVSLRSEGESVVTM